MSQPRFLLDKTLPEWARLSGVKASTIRARIDAWEWTEAEAVGLVPHVDLRGKCRGKPVTIAYKKALDKGQKVEHNEVRLENIKWF